ncbi:MAG TPA: MBL fold metallo-hydrolase [Anaerolineae bacterium]|nr:MBL fold metallo-hydrolase [Anaerolineae bacterium]
MPKFEKFGEVEQVSITVIVDNKADLIVDSNEMVSYFEDEPLLAEHGFSALIRLGDPAISVLWDGGVSCTALVENLRRMKIDPTSINKVVLSHGHRDHYAALTDVLLAMALQPEEREWEEQVTSSEINRWIEDHQIHLIAHPAVLRERWWVKDDGVKLGPYFPPPIQAWESAGAKMILSKDPYQLGPGCWTTGYIPRRSFEETGRPTKLHYREGDTFVRDDMEDDQALVINVKDKGLVVLSGCAHAGIVNTVEYAIEISGNTKVLAIIGGFHLAPANDDEIQQTIDHIKSLSPKLVVPSHCTGFRAQCFFASQMPDEFIEGVVGATYSF